MRENKEFTGDMPEMEISKEELKQLEIEHHLVSYNKSLKYSRSPYVLMGYFFGIGMMLWTAFSFNANPRRIIPMYDGLGDVLVNHLFFVFSQVFFLYILPFGGIMLITTIVFSQFKLPELPELKQKIEKGEDIIPEIAKKLWHRGRIRRIAVVVVFLVISVFTMFSVGFRLKEVFIYNESDLEALTHVDSGKRIILMNDITIEEDSIFSFEEFTGVFEGNGYTISGIEASSPLFGANYGLLANVHFEDVTCSNVIDVSFLTSRNFGTISNVSINNIQMNQRQHYRSVSYVSFSVISTINYGVIQDVSLSNIEYNFQEYNTTDDFTFRVSGITRYNYGVLNNIYMTPYTVENLPSEGRTCVVSCIRDDAFDTAYNPLEAIIHNVKVDAPTLDLLLYEDTDFLRCFGCINDFDLENQMYETPGTYWQIKYPDLSNEIPDYF